MSYSRLRRCRSIDRNLLTHSTKLGIRPLLLTDVNFDANQSCPRLVNSTKPNGPSSIIKQLDNKLSIEWLVFCIFISKHVVTLSLSNVFFLFQRKNKEKILFLLMDKERNNKTTNLRAPAPRAIVPFSFPPVVFEQNVTRHDKLTTKFSSITSCWL